MRLSRRADYALRAVRHCSGLPKGSHDSINTIAENEAVPREFLAKILKDLTRNGILISYRGTKGGYAMARPPHKITFLNVIEAVDGPIRFNVCTDDTRKHLDGCKMCTFWKAQENSVKNVLNRQNFGKYRKSPKTRKKSNL